MDFHRAKYILPNLFTLSSMGAGLYSIHLSATAQTVSDISLAAWLLVVSMICDLLDGRVARMTKTETELGIQLDSMSDAISFGVAPAFLLYQWGMTEWGMVGQLAAFGYVACAILRLARFNVLANEDVKTKRYFLGLPTPLAAGTVVAMVMAHVAYTEAMAITGSEGLVAALSLLLGGLMVSNIRYRTFKDLDMSGKTPVVASVVVGLSVAVSVMLKPSVTFVLIMLAYIVLGLGGGILNVGRALLGLDEEADEPVFAEIYESE